MYANGCNVLSEEYSNPSFVILNSFIFPIVFDFGMRYASLPLTELDPLKNGNFL